ncbi:MAG: serine/threonine protein kinase [Planctomycetaceae bacterium]|nr:serine/threonine protein kinase [Planctomycetaceae bacterium]
MSRAEEYFGPYRVVNVVNVGQTSTLLQGYGSHSREFVGIKTLQNRFARDRTQLSYLQWEYNVAKTLEHEKIIAIHSFGWDNKRPYLLMEWFPELNIKTHINSGYDNYAYMIVPMIRDMTEALGYLHEKKWVHRDIKPDNFLYGEGKGLRLIDFALTKKIKMGVASMFGFRSKAQGTASYIAPEQILSKAIDPRSDVYSLGCTFFELLSGKPPFTANSPTELLQKHVSAQIPSITAKNRNVTPEMSDMLYWMLAKRPDDRPKNCTELFKLMTSVRVFKRIPTKEKSWGM